MVLQRNMGTPERVLRGVVGIWLLVMTPGAWVGGRRTTAVITAIAGIGSLFNAKSGFCGGHALAGIDTTGNDSTSTS